MFEVTIFCSTYALIGAVTLTCRGLMLIRIILIKHGTASCRFSSICWRGKIGMGLAGINDST